MPAKKGKPPDKDKDKDKDYDPNDDLLHGRKRMSSGEVDVDDAVEVVEEKKIHSASGRLVKLDTLAGKTAQVEMLRNQVSDLRTQLDIRDIQMREMQEEKDALNREVELLRIAVKDADKQDSHIHILEETIAEKDKKIAELLNAQVAIADASLSADNGEDNSAGVEPITPSSSGLSPKFDNLSFREPEDSDSD